VAAPSTRPAVATAQTDETVAAPSTRSAVATAQPDAAPSAAPGASGDTAGTGPGSDSTDAGSGSGSTTVTGVLGALLAVFVVGCVATTVAWQHAKWRALKDADIRHRARRNPRTAGNEAFEGPAPPPEHDVHQAGANDGDYAAVAGPYGPLSGAHAEYRAGVAAEGTYAQAVDAGIDSAA